jgi:WhiB family redox-sensing transcriptional regulator
MTGKRGAPIGSLARKIDIGGDQSWVSKGSCYRHSTPDLWFPLPDDKATERRAKQVCIECPVATECLEWALRNKELGIWGGRSESERRRGITQPPEPQPPRQLQPCGTVAAYRRHIAHGERPCTPCRAAESRNQSLIRRRRGGQ